MVLTASGRAGDDDRSKYSSCVRHMTPEVLQEICKERNMWTQPHLNTQLYLNYKGFESISGLEDYIAVKALHLGNNHIARIDGLDRMTALRSLHLEGNRLTRIENLGNCRELRQLNLEGNAIARVEGLMFHTKLEQLNLAHNTIARLEDLSELSHLPNLNNIDVSHNQIEEAEGVVEFWSGLQAQIRVLRYHANPGVRSIEHYRKRLINGMPLLSYLDERPVFPVERRSSKAWAEGGTEAMHRAKREFVAERNRMQIGVDPERREILTRMRKLALERINRETRERQEKEEQEAAARHSPPEAVESGDLEALDAYAAKWRSKVQLHGADAVRAQGAVVEGAAREEPRPALAECASASSPSPTRSFAPPPRTAHEAAARPRPESEGPGVEPSAPAARAPSARVVAAATASAARRQCASDFRVRSSSASGGSEGAGSQDAFQERQFAVLGGDDVEIPALLSASSSSARPGRGDGSARGLEREVMPHIWQGNLERTVAEEMRCVEQNMAASCKSGASTAADELSALD
mmetsp:Transcript_31394/g.91675  ORF Transcript_31394/g.91675 Transcript_31394/m.91675 type:complete len:523 (+) Transcript_31394:150-1718(+)